MSLNIFVFFSVLTKEISFFSIPPNVSSELHLPSSEIHVELKLVKEDGSTISASTQVGIINAFGALMWDSAFVRINGWYMNMRICLTVRPSVGPFVCGSVHPIIPFSKIICPISKTNVRDPFLF